MKLVDKKEMENLIGKLDTLDDQHKEFLKNRWLHYLYGGMSVHAEASGSTIRCAA